MKLCKCEKMLHVFCYVVGILVKRVEKVVISEKICKKIKCCHDFVVKNSISLSVSRLLVFVSCG